MMLLDLFAMEWFKNHWETVVTIGCLLIAAFVEAWQQATAGLPSTSHFPKLEGDWHFVPLILLIAAGIVWLIGRRSSRQLSDPTAQSPYSTIGIPTLSGLLGQNPDVTFDPKKFFAFAYYSPVTAEIEANVRAIAQKHYPNDKEGFYARFIGVGYVSCQHEITWLMIFGSQLAAMGEMSARGLIPIAELKKHYDKAAIAYPKTYAHYSFVEWVNFLKIRILIAIYPTQMVELPYNGKDFLRYLAHTGYNGHDRVN
jgi:hypothetical protein